MKNDRTKTIFYLDLKHVHKPIRMGLQNSSPIRCFLQNKWAQNMPAEEKKTKTITK